MSSDGAIEINNSAISAAGMSVQIYKVTIVEKYTFVGRRAANPCPPGMLHDAVLKMFDRALTFLAENYGEEEIEKFWKKNK